MTSRLVPRIVQPRHTGGPGGVDHGAKGHVLIELREDGVATRRLIWIGGSRSAGGVRGFGRTYHPASLSLIDGQGYAAAYPTLSGGRLTRTRLEADAALIDAHFGDGAAAAVDPARTLVIER